MSDDTPKSAAPEASPAPEAANSKHAREKWTEIEHLPQWDEEFYHVYTAKKHGKWLMLKTLRPEYRDNPEYQAMLEKEFEVRYNLAHSHIVMINDLEDVPGLGLCIITDDVYGKSLRKLIDAGELKQHHVDKLCNQLLDAMYYIQSNHIVHHPIRAERIIYTENIENLKLIDVGFDQKDKLSRMAASDDIYNFGLMLREALDHLPKPEPDEQHRRMLQYRVADRCTDPNPKRRYRDVIALRLALQERTSQRIYIGIIAFLALMMIMLVILLKLD